MIDTLDEALREFLIREMPVRENEIDISFEQPKREWSARLSRPSLNLFLVDVRENAKLRSNQPVVNEQPNGNQVILSRQPIRLELYYLVTAWAKDPLDEHRILGRMLAALFRYRSIPDEILAEFAPEQTAGVTLKLAQVEHQYKPNEIWSVLDNELRPAIDIVASFLVNPFSTVTQPVTSSVQVNLNQMSPSQTGQVAPKPRPGTVVSRLVHKP